MEVAYRALRLRGEPRLTRFVASAMAKSHWYDMGPAREAFGYVPRVRMAIATERTAAWLRSRGVVRES